MAFNKFIDKLVGSDGDTDVDSEGTVEESFYKTSREAFRTKSIFRESTDSRLLKE